MAKTDAENLVAVAEAIADFREGEIPKPTPAHVEKWLSQFEPSDQSAVLSGTLRLVERSYLTKAETKEWLKVAFTTTLFFGSDPIAWLQRANFIVGHAQLKGGSQYDLLTLLDEVMKENAAIKFKLDDCGAADGDYVYLDDCIYTGWRVINDLTRWLGEYAGPKCILHVVTAVTYGGGEHWVNKKLAPLASEKGVSLRFQKMFKYQNFPGDHGTISMVLRPAVVPNDSAVQTYFQKLKPIGQTLRLPATGAYSDSALFASEKERQVLEGAFLKVGAMLVGAATNPKPSVRPMGYLSLEGLGFGATFFTYRNTPNNAPLALWYGDPDYPTSHPFGMWYPLVPRRPK